MPVSILPPALGLPAERRVRYQPADDEELRDSEGDVDMEGIAWASKQRKTSRQHIVTPGEIVTNDPQWMRSVIRSPISL